MEIQVFQMGFLVFDFLGGSMMKGKIPQTLEPHTVDASEIRRENQLIW